MSSGMEPVSWRSKISVRYWMRRWRGAPLKERIQRSVDLLEAMEGESNSGDNSLLPTSPHRISRLPFVSSTGKAEEGTRTPATPAVERQDSSNISPSTGLTGQAKRDGKEQTSLTPKPTSLSPPGSSAPEDGDTGPLSTSADDCPVGHWEPGFGPCQCGGQVHG